METQKHTLSRLYQDFLHNRLDPKEAEQFRKLFDMENELLLKGMVEKALSDPESPSYARSDEQQRLDSIFQNVKRVISQNNAPKPLLKTGRYILAAVAAIAIAVIGTLLYFGDKGPQAKRADTALLDVLPGGNKAILTLAGGKKISLTDANVGLIGQQSGVSLTKTKDGKLVYASPPNPKAPLTYNTIETPNGGQYQVALPDGTKVWLNAASSLKYPVSFGALKERRVELVGEAYFEVAHNKALPFLVVTRDQTVQVLGTHFNVNSYSNEDGTATTLAEGSVKISSGRQASIIKPGERSLLAHGTIKVMDADMESALAWKDGNMIFKNADLPSIMRQIERWYDIKVIYEGRPNKRLFTGGLPRNTKLSVLLDVLKDNAIKFRVEETASGKTLFVTN